MSGLPVRPGVLLAAVAVVQWLVFAAVSAAARAPIAKKALLRRQEKALLASSAVVLIVFFIVFDGLSLVRGTRSAPAAGAGVVSARKQTGSCASLDAGMQSAAVEERVGKPDEVRTDEEVRGPGAVTWLYRDSRCAVHFVDGKVEFID